MWRTIMALKVSQNGDEVIIKIHLENEDNKIETSLSKKDYCLQLTGKFLETLRNFSILVVCLAIAQQFKYTQFYFIYYFFIALAFISGILSFLKFVVDIVDLHRAYKGGGIGFITFIMILYIFSVEVGTIFIFFQELWLKKIN